MHSSDHEIELIDYMLFYNVSDVKFAKTFVQTVHVLSQ
jgi:hypothetical protein